MSTMYRKIPRVIKSSSDMHNQNAYAYFCKLKIPKTVLNAPDEITKLFNEIKKIQQEEYDSKTEYSKLFSKFYELIEKHSSYFEENPHDDFIISIYENLNDNLHNSFEYIKNIVDSTAPHMEKTEKLVYKLLDDPWHWRITTPSKLYPSKEEWFDRRLKSVQSDTFTPQSRTNLPFVLQNDSNLKQLHFGTQVRVVKNKIQIPKTFELFIKAKENKRETHLYINNLGLDREQVNSSILSTIKRTLKQEGMREYLFTKKLHELEEKEKEKEKEKHENLYVVTLPADHGEMHHDYYKITNKYLPIAKIKSDILDVLNNPSNINKPNSKNIKDFYLGEKVREKLYKDNNNQEFHERLLIKSLKTLGLDNKEELSIAEKQAVHFHLFKYELTKEIINAVNPSSMNFSCKDAIDRGKASYAYFNLMKSIDEEKPWNMDQFNEALHGTSAMVKGRGMNKHHAITWNVIDVYVNGKYAKLKNDDKLKWIIEWRDLNCPKERVNKLLADRIKQAEQEFQLEPQESIYNKVLKIVKDTKSSSSNYNKVLLTVLATCMAIKNFPNNEEENSRRLQTIQKIPESNSTFSYLKGLALKLLGTILLSKKLVEQGEDLMLGVPNYAEINDLLKASKK